jgi:hypothetical protein
MKPILRNILAVVLGIVLGSIVNLTLVGVGPHVIALPEGVDTHDRESLRNSMHLFEPKHFVFVFLGHALGTLIGSLAAYLVAGSYRAALAYGIGVFFLVGGISFAVMVARPVWFTALDLTAAYLPMAWLATWIGRGILGGTVDAPDQGEK